MSGYIALNSIRKDVKNIGAELVRSIFPYIFTKVPKIKLNNGTEIPIIGLGTWKSKPGEVTQAVKDAIDVGYRHFDCAWIYENEKEIGEAITAKIKAGTVKRKDLYITSKLWNTFHRPDLVLGAITDSLNSLNLKYLDLYLIHWPMAFKEGCDGFPESEDGKLIFSDVDYVDTWKAMESLQKQGLTKSIGLSNFNKNQIERILKVAEIKPVMNQIECHPYFNQKKLIDFCKSKSIAITAYSPLGCKDRSWAQPGDPQLLEDPDLIKFASKLKKSVAQVVLRYQIEKGIIVIPKAVAKNEILEDFNIFNFSLSKEDMTYLDSFDRCSGRILIFPTALGHPHHPFENDDF